MDNATRKIWSASSLGVFLREAPSTMAIILSMKPSPGLLLISTTIQSDMTVVPPVTALLSPPLSRITGADSPVIALSSTEAAPSITSPSAGICSPAFIYTISPFFSSVDLTCVILSFWPGDGILDAMVSLLPALSASAWALPLPSAIASAKLPNSTVNQRMTDMASMYPGSASLTPARAKPNMARVRMADTNTMNMTGFFTWVRGFSFRKESFMARLTIFLSENIFFLRSLMSH